jgi:uncharacterized protein
MSHPQPVRVTTAHARRFHRRAVLLDHHVSDVQSALLHHGYVQIDPINVCGRMHDLILRNRVTQYREGDLMRHLHGHPETLTSESRLAFEHFIPSPGVLAAFPMNSWRFLRRSMKRRSEQEGAWSGRLTAEEKALSKTILREIARRGPLSSEDFDDNRKATAVWGAATLVKSTMQKLFFHGELLIAKRAQGQRRIYDLTERVLPASVRQESIVGESEGKRWEIHLRLRQRRLIALKRGEIDHVNDLVSPVIVDDETTLYCLRDDLSLFDETRLETDAQVTPLLLAPLDPLVYDRKVTSALWGFDYIWEVYTPPAKRTRGYYALPVLAGTNLVGHVDPKADREKNKLRVVSRSVQRGHTVTHAVNHLAEFLGLKR